MREKKASQVGAGVWVSRKRELEPGLLGLREKGVMGLTSRSKRGGGWGSGLLGLRGEGVVGLNSGV